MSRVARWLAALAVAMLSWLQPAASEALAVTQPFPAHTYDSPIHDVPPAHTASERGPPLHRSATSTASAGQHVADHGSGGLLARPYANATVGTYDYDDSPTFVHAGGGGIDGTEAVGASSGASPALQSGRVAAES